MNQLIESLRGKLIVSSQALEGNALRDSATLARMALAAQKGGAAAIRANGVEDITAMKKLINIPIIGLNKEARTYEKPFITPSFEHAKEIAETGAQIIALDATLRPRDCGISAADLIRRVKKELGVLVMADIALYEDGIAAAEAGADLISTTLSGYTMESPKMPGPDLELIRRLAKDVDVPIVAEGRYCTCEDVASAFRAGAYAVVIGKSITNPEFITRYFIDRIPVAVEERTESVNVRTFDFDQKSALEMAEAINREDMTVAMAVGRALPEIAEVAEIAAEKVKNGGRIIYTGAGTSGRLAVQDAAECPPTYGVSPETIQTIMAGGEGAVFRAAEGAEDDFQLGINAAEMKKLTSNDIVIGISANGNAKFVCGVLSAAEKAGAATAAIVNNPGGSMAEIAGIVILLETGAEVICGSTRMKAGTSQKMTLNMISTIAMTRCGYVTGNMMTSMKPTNKKLKERAAFMVGKLCSVSVDQAREILEKCDWNIKTAVNSLKG